MSALSTVLDLAPAPLLREPRQPGLQRPAPRMVEDDRSVDAARVADLQRVQVGLERVPEQDRRGRRREHGHDVRLDVLERRRRPAERFRSYARPARQVVRHRLPGLHERVVHDDARGVVDQADARELLPARGHALPWSQHAEPLYSEYQHAPSRSPWRICAGCSH